MEFITEFFWFCVKAVFWYWVVGLFLGLLSKRAEVKLEEKTEMIAKLNNLVHRVRVERHGDTHYWFDDDNGDFLGQGKTSDEVIEHIRSRFPTHLFFLPSYKKVHAPNWKIESYELQTLATDMSGRKNESQ